MSQNRGFTLPKLNLEKRGSVMNSIERESKLESTSRDETFFICESDLKRSIENLKAS
jgi:hypothetical protein